MAARDIIQAAAGAAGAAEAVYVEDVFSTYLYAGNSSTQTITNGIDLATKGGMVWTKARSVAYAGEITDTVRGIASASSSAYSLVPSTTAAQSPVSDISSFNTNGFSLIFNSGSGNYSPQTYASWTFRKQAKFFDVVTWTGNGVAGRQIAHSLGATPGMIIVKRTDTSSEWVVYHKGLTSASYYVMLQSTSAEASLSTIWNSTAPTNSVFSVGINSTVNVSGGTYVAYLFADSNSGGFGPAGTDSVVACGSVTTDSSGNYDVNIGWEPQYLLMKRTDSATGGGWYLVDNMRGFCAPDVYANTLSANTSSAESAANAAIHATSVGFKGGIFSNATYIYLAIRRGPMKTPTDATKVFYPQTRTANGTATKITGVGFAPDLVWSQRRDAAGNSPSSIDKLRGPKAVLFQNGTGAEGTSGANQDVESFDMDGVSVGSSGALSVINYLSSQVANWYFRRAPGFMDCVCYTGTGSATTVAHNLGVAPELMIVKSRSDSSLSWPVYYGDYTAFAYLNASSASSTGSSAAWNANPTASVFSVGTSLQTNYTSSAYVAYLFATCPGVSKVGSYTGTGAAQNIDCGFTAGARFVLIKRTDSAGNWRVFDTARGIVNGNDPALSLNSTDAEYGDADFLTPYSAGFGLTSVSGVNANGGSFIFLAIA